MVAPNINDSILVLVEPTLSRSSSIDHQDDEDPHRIRRRVSNRTIVTRASLKGLRLSHYDAVSILKETFESWTSDAEFHDRLTKKQMNHAVITLQRITRGWMARSHTRIIQLEQRLSSIRLGTQKELAEIQREKVRRMQDIKNQVEREHQIGAHDNDKTAVTAKKIIDQLRQENHKIRKQNDEIHAKTLELQIVNQQLENAQQRAEATLAEIARHIEQTKERIEQKEAEQAALVKEFQEQVESFEALNESTLAEQSIKGRYEQAMKIILDTLRERMTNYSSDLKDELVDALVEHKKTIAI